MIQLTQRCVYHSATTNTTHLQACYTGSRTGRHSHTWRDGSESKSRAVVIILVLAIRMPLHSDSKKTAEVAQTQAKQHARPLHSRLELWNIKCQSNTCTVRSEYFIAHLPNYVRISEEKSFDVWTVIFASLLSNPQKLKFISQTRQWNPLYMYAYRYIVTQLREINPRGRQSCRKFGKI